MFLNPCELIFFKSFYAPNNMLVVLVGDVNIQRVKEMADRYYGPVARNQKLEGLKASLDHPDRYQFKKRKRGEVLSFRAQNKIPMWMMAFEGKPYGKKEAFILDILASILGEGDSSYLNQQLVLGKRPLLVNVSAGHYTLKNSGVFYISGQLLKRVSLKNFRRRMQHMSKSLCSKSITARSVTKVKNQYLVSFVHSLETNSGMAHFLGEREHGMGDYKYYKKELEMYDRITPEQVRSACVELFEKNYHQHHFISVSQGGKRK